MASAGGQSRRSALAPENVAEQLEGVLTLLATAVIAAVTAIVIATIVAAVPAIVTVVVVAIAAVITIISALVSPGILRSCLLRCCLLWHCRSYLFKDLVEFAAVKPDAAAFWTVIDLYAVALAH